MRLATGSAVLGLFLFITLALRTVTPQLAAHPQVGGGELLWKMMDADPEEVWEGTITWHEVGSRSFDRDDSNSRKIDTEHLLHTVNSTVEVRICGPLASMHLSGISKNRSDERSYRKHRRNPVARCWDDDPELRHEGRFDDGSWLPPDMMGASVAMSVDPATCGLHGFEDAEERVNRQCLPKVIYEAVLAHELQHVRQCQSDQAAFGNTADFHSFARYEVEAHLVGINHLKNYVENHCQESGNLYNMSDVNARIARLEAWLGH